MANEILHKYAEDQTGKIIYIDNAVKGTNYYCPNCKEKFTFRKGEVRQQHFSHSNTSSCTGEGYLHKTFKKLLVEFLKEHIINKKTIGFTAQCNVCNKVHTYTLLQGMVDVLEEYNMDVCRPDISLLNDQKIIPLVIEIIDKHEIEESAYNFYQEKGITVLRIKIETISDLENIEEKIKKPTTLIINNNLVCLTVRQKFQQQMLLQQRLQNQPISEPYSRKQSRYRTGIEQVEADFANRKRKQHFAIQGKYKNKSKRK